jgi:putative thiamine transport system ATP-binding protein
VFQVTGQVLLGGRELLALTPQQRRIGLMFQQDLLFPHLTAAENVAFGLSAGLPHRARQMRAKAILEAVDMAAFAARYPDQLSGGQRARIALLRALAAEPDAILLDEPFAHLDPAARARLRDWTAAQIITRAIPALLVSHDREDGDIATGPGIALTVPTEWPDR